jgi:acyl carrier protein/GNAT superfamily N-acetyltransferase
VNRLEVERAVVETVRRGVLLGSEREYSLEQPLGDQGLGLDSLALVGVVTQLEKTFSVVFPESFWSERPQLTLGRLADTLLAAGAESAESLRPPPRSSAQEPPRACAGRWARLAWITREQGLASALRWATSRLVDNVVRLVYERETFFLLAFDLDAEPLPRYMPSLELELRAVTPAEAPALDALWKTEPNMRAHPSFSERLPGDYIRLAAWHQGQLVGIDLLSAMGVDSSVTGLKVRVNSGGCWGQALHERRSFEGMGVGLSLLAFSLAEARRRGYRRQLTYVSAGNLRMLSAAVHLLGFQKIGRIETTWILRRPFSRWQVGERSGWGGTLAL